MIDDFKWVTEPVYDRLLSYLKEKGNYTLGKDGPEKWTVSDDKGDIVLYKELAGLGFCHYAKRTLYDELFDYVNGRNV